MAFSQLIVADRSGKALEELTAEVQYVNWRLNDIGQCRFNIAANDPKATETNLRFGNRILIQNDNGLPNWVGTIEPPRKWNRGQITINGFDPGYIFKYRTTDKSIYFESETVGAIFSTLITSTNQDQNTGVILGSIYESGPGYSPEYHLKKIFDIFDKSLTTKLSTYEFAFTGDLVNGVVVLNADFYESKGGDKTNFAFIEDRNVNVTLDEQGPIINSWSIAGEGTEWDADRLVGTATDLDSKDIYGLREDAQVLGDVSLQATLDDTAANLLEKTSNPYNIFSLTAQDKEPAKFADYDTGDQVQLIAPSIGFGGTDTIIRVLSREFLPQSGLCNLVVQEVV